MSFTSHNNHGIKTPQFGSMEEQKSFFGGNYRMESFKELSKDCGDSHNNK